MKIKAYQQCLLVICQMGYLIAYMQIKENPTIEYSDIVNTEKYMKFSIDPHLTNYAQDIEYFYIESDLCSLSQFNESYSLQFVSNEEQDQSSHLLQEMKYTERNSCLYTVQVKYQCPQNKYLINYQLLLQDKEDTANKWQIYWKKICTETKIPRNGLNIDLQLSEKNEIIPLVQNGINVSNEALQLDKTVDKAKFIFYLQNQQSQDNTAETELPQQDDQQKQKKEEQQEQKDSEIKSNLSVLKNMVLQINEEIIQKPILYFNKQEVDIKLKGNLNKGGSISKQGNFDQSIKDEDTILLEFDCLQSGDTELELLVPLVHFDDIKVIIKKNCGINIKEELIQIERRIGLELIFFIVFILFTLTHFIYSTLVKNQNVIQSYPFLLSIVYFLLQRDFIQRNQKWNDLLTSFTRQQTQGQIKQQQADETTSLNQSQNFNQPQSYVNDETNIFDEQEYKSAQNSEEGNYQEINIEQQQDFQEEQQEIIEYSYI